MKTQLVVRRVRRMTMFNILHFAVFNNSDNALSLASRFFGNSSTFPYGINHMYFQDTIKINLEKAAYQSDEHFQCSYQILERLVLSLDLDIFIVLLISYSERTKLKKYQSLATK